MTPTLPQDSKDGPLRDKALEIARERYRYSYRYPPEAAWAAEVPKGEGYSIHYLADYLKLEATLKANHVAAEVGGLQEFDSSEHAAARASMRPEDIGENLFRIGRGLVEGMEHKRFETIEDFARFFAVLEEPPLMPLFRGTPAEQDELFAWQRLAGANPMMLEGIDAIPDHFPVDESHFKRALDARAAGRPPDAPGDTLAAALAEGRLFIADYQRMDGLASGKSGDAPKYLYAPMALFVRPLADTAALLPVAIQCGQRPGHEFPIWTPQDGYRWRMARTIVQIADGNDHETRQHLGKAHAVMEAVVLAARRNLPPQHPLSVLLAPHFETTLQINDSAKNSLIAPGGGVERVLAGTLESSVKLTAMGLAEFRLDEATPPTQLAARRVHDVEALPCFPYRDDGIQVWDAIREFVGDYVALYYRDERAVTADSELRGFFAELGSPDGGRIRGVSEVTTRPQLAERLATILFTASAQHSALNYAQFAMMGMIPNLPGAAYAKAPTADTPDTERSLMALLPPVDVATEHFTLAYQLSNIRRNHLGEYPLLHWKHAPARTLADGFAQRLLDVERLIASRDEDRRLSYPFLKPSMIAASIHI